MNLSIPEAGEIPLIRRTRGGLRFELVLAPDAVEEAGGALPPDEDAAPSDGESPGSRGDPFVYLSDAGRFSRVLLGRIAIGEDTTLRYLAVKIQRSRYRPSGPAAGIGPITNAQIDESWRRERARLLETASAEGVVSLFDFGDEFFRQRPVTFCCKTREYFHPLCPRCRGPMEDCRDDEFLRDCGLPPYSESTARYLHCAACRSAAEAPTFYAYSKSPDERPRENVVIRRRNELYRDAARIVLREGTGADIERLERVFPCYRCEHRTECYPPDADLTREIPAESRLVPLSYHEFHALALDALEFHLDEFSDLLGGAEWSEVRRRAIESPSSSGRGLLLDSLDRQSRSLSPWIHYGTTDAFPLEVLRLKVIAFSQLCRGVRGYHALCRAPHLNLSPAGIMVRVPPPGPDLPAWWNFRVEVTGLASSRRFGASDDECGVTEALLVPSDDTPEEYRSPIIRRTSFGREESMTIEIQSAEAEGDRVSLEATARSSQARLSEYHEGDVVRIVASSRVSRLEDVTLWGSIVERPADEFRLRLFLPGRLEPSSLQAPVTLEGSVAFYKRFHVPCDLYSLGLLLFRMILVNDEHDIHRIEDSVRRILNRMRDSFPQGGPVREFKDLRSRIEWEIESEDKIFDRKSVLYSRADRDGTRSAIPSPVWSDLLVLGFRLLLNIPGFSFCAHHADYSPERPEEVMDEVLAVLDEISRRLHVELFAKAQRDGEISTLCEELIAEASAEEIAPGEIAPGEASGESELSKSES